jgi:H+-transporting ATPase
MKLGDVIPADAILLPGKPISVDQSALTGESLPITAGPGALIMMSSAIKMGHCRAIIVATGKNTFIGYVFGTTSIV